MLQVGARLAPPASPARASSGAERCLRIARDHLRWSGFDAVDGRGEALAALEHRLAFADGSVDAIYLDRVLEFLDLSEGAILLRECRRVLARGGRLRVVTADLARVLEQHGSAEAWKGGGWFGNGYDWALMRVRVLNRAFRDGGRRWLYDETELARVATLVGLRDPQRCRAGESADPRLAGRENASEVDLVVELDEACPRRGTAPAGQRAGPTLSHDLPAPDRRERARSNLRQLRAGAVRRRPARRRRGGAADVRGAPALRSHPLLSQRRTPGRRAQLRRLLQEGPRRVHQVSQRRRHAGAALSRGDGVLPAGASRGDAGDVASPDHRRAGSPATRSGLHAAADWPQRDRRRALGAGADARLSPELHRRAEHGDVPQVRAGDVHAELLVGSGDQLPRQRGRQRLDEPAGAGRAPVPDRIAEPVSDSPDADQPRSGGDPPGQDRLGSRRRRRGGAGPLPAGSRAGAGCAPAGRDSLVAASADRAPRARARVPGSAPRRRCAVRAR